MQLDLGVIKRAQHRCAIVVAGLRTLQIRVKLTDAGVTSPWLTQAAPDFSHYSAQTRAEVITGTHENTGKSCKQAICSQGCHLSGTR